MKKQTAKQQRKEVIMQTLMLGENYTKKQLNEMYKKIEARIVKNLNETSAPKIEKIKNTVLKQNNKKNSKAKRNRIKASVWMNQNERINCHFTWDGDNIFNLSFKVENYIGLTKLKMLKRAFEETMNKSRDLSKIDYYKIFEDVTGLPVILS
jgi:hypothetical protein